MNRNLLDISKQMKRFEQMNDTLASAAVKIRELSTQNQGLMELATHSMGLISDSAEASMANIQKLPEASEKIGGIIRTITDISIQTKLLALNATIEVRPAYTGRAQIQEAGRSTSVITASNEEMSEQIERLVEISRWLIEEPL